MDTVRSCSPVTFMSNMLYACSILYKMKLPFIIAMNKVLSLFILVDLWISYDSPSSINLIPAQAGKKTVGLALHYTSPSQTSVVFPPTGSQPWKGRRAPRLCCSRRRATVLYLHRAEQNKDLCYFCIYSHACVSK